MMQVRFSIWIRNLISFLKWSVLVRFISQQFANNYNILFVKEHHDVLFIRL